MKALLKSFVGNKGDSEDSENEKENRIGVKRNKQVHFLQEDSAEMSFDMSSPNP